MENLQRLSRRLFLRSAGRNATVVAVLGPGVLAACSSDGEISVSATTAVEEQSSSTTTATAPPSTESVAPTDSAAPATEAGEGDALRWERVVLGNVSAYVLARNGRVAVVDTGRSGSGDDIGAALSALDTGWDRVGDVVLTHLHGDHVGGLPEVLERAPSATPWAGEADIAGIGSPRPIQPLNDGDEVFGLEVIATPGHTPGHISVLDPGAGFLVAGDAMVERSGMILGPVPEFTADLEQAHASVARLAERRFETVVFGHGDPVLAGASDAVVALAQSL